MSGMSTDGHEPFQLAGLAGLYALDALEGDDLVRFEAHLQTDPELQQEVAEFRATAARLSEVSATPAPAGMRERVLAGVAATRQDPPVVRLDDRRQALARRRLLLGAVAAVAVILAGLGGFFVAERTDDAGTQLADVLAQPDAKVLPLTGVGSGVAAGHVVVSPATGRVVLISGQMPQSAEGRTMEVWKLDAEGAHKAGLFRADESGKAEAVMELDLDGATGFAITDEPEGGSEEATTPVLMQATLE